MYPNIYFVALALAAAAAAQDVSNLPTCAQGCLGTSIQDSGCRTIDFNCFCSDTNLITNLSCCIFKSCSDADQQATLTFANGICRVAQPPVELPQSASCPASAGSSSTADEGSFYAQTTMPPTSTPNFLLPPITETVFSSGYLASLYSRVSAHASSRVLPFPIASSVNPSISLSRLPSMPPSESSSSTSTRLTTSHSSAPASSATSSVAAATSDASSEATPTASSGASSSPAVTSAPASSTAAATGAAQSSSSVMTGAAPAYGRGGELTGLVGGLVGAAAFFL